jgi:hypothetical protein
MKAFGAFVTDFTSMNWTLHSIFVEFFMSNVVFNLCISALVAFMHKRPSLTTPLSLSRWLHKIFRAVSLLATRFMWRIFAGRARCFRSNVLTRSWGSSNHRCLCRSLQFRLPIRSWQLPLSCFIAFAHRHFIFYKFSWPRIPGGSLMPIPPPLSPPVATLTLSAP